MASASSKTKKPRAKPPKSRPQATHQLSQPVTNDAWTSTILTAFSSNAECFALVSLAVDKHRLRVFNVNASQAIAEHSVEGARVTALRWIQFDTSDGSAANGAQEQSPKKKRKKSEKQKELEKESDTIVQAVALGLSDGTVQIFSVKHGRIVRTLSVPSSSAAILALEQGVAQDGSLTLWASYKDGSLRLWDTKKNVVLTTVSTEKRAQYSALAVAPGSADDDALRILAASNGIQLLSIQTSTSSSAVTAKEICSYTGHASPVKALRWDPPSPDSPSRFYSAAEDDRFVYIWDAPDGTMKGKLAASYPIEADVRQIAVTSTQNSKVLLVTAASGKVSLVPVPNELSASGTKSSKTQVPTLLSRSTVVLAKKKGTSAIHIIDAAFDGESTGSLRVAVSDGAQVGFVVARYMDDAGDFIADVNVEYSALSLASVKEKDGFSSLRRRYAEGTELAISAGEHVGASEPLDNPELEGALDVDLAELSLGQRLAVRNGTDMQVDPRSSGSDQEQDDAELPSSSSKQKANSKTEKGVPAHSLSRTLTQALHSSDTGLLESCLRHTNKDLIHNTVQRLPPQLVVPLLMACVERLGRGARGNNMKGGGGGASTQRGLGLIAWVKSALTVHSGYLMTMPDLVARLSHLHATLTSRLALQEQLLGLSGRLDLVLAQVELRSSTAPAPLKIKSNKRSKVGKVGAREPQKYVEGESSDEEDEDEGGMDVEIEDADDGGSVEDVELGGFSDDESGSEDEESEEDDEDIDDSEEDDEDEDEDEEGADAHGNLNGFIDDEAEEDYEEDESDDYSE